MKLAFQLLIFYLVVVSLIFSKRRNHSKRVLRNEPTNPMSGSSKCLPARINEQFRGSNPGKCPTICKETRCEQRVNRCCLYHNQFSKNSNMVTKPGQPQKNNVCPQAYQGELSKGFETRICEAKCPETRCQQVGINCCYYNNPKLEKGKYGDSRGKASFSSNYGNNNQYTGNGNFGSGYPVSDGSESFSSRYGSPYKS